MIPAYKHRHLELVIDRSPRPRGWRRTVRGVFAVIHRYGWALLIGGALLLSALLGAP
jgi:hypothetical protein